jgi:NAD(P)H-flavin reductase
VSTVTGVAPFVSYTRTLFKDWKEGKFKGEHKLFLLNGASRPWEFGYREELEELARQVPWFRCVFTASRPWEDETWHGEVGRVDELIRKYADQWGCAAANSIGYLCGHPDMIEHGKGILKRAGFKKENLKEEVYWIPAKTAAE